MEAGFLDMLESFVGDTGEFPHWLHSELLVPDLLAVSDVSPWLVEVTLGMKAQQCDACFNNLEQQKCSEMKWVV